MKKAFVLFIILALLSVSLLGCRPTVSELEDRIAELESALAEKDGEYDKLLKAYEAETGKAYDEENPDLDVLLFDEEEVLKQLNITRYTYQFDFYGRTVYSECFEIENTSVFNIALSGEFHYLDENGSLVGVATSTHNAIGPNQTAVIYNRQETPYSDCELKLNATLDKEHISAVSDLSYEVTEANDKLIVSVTNTGKKAVKSVSAFVLYFKDGQVVDMGTQAYFDADHEFKPGKTITNEFAPANVEYDSYKVYLHGQR